MQPENTELPMLVTFLGIVIFERPVQPENALFPILVMLSGITTSVISLHPEKALFPIPVTLYPRFSGITTRPVHSLHPLIHAVPSLRMKKPHAISSVAFTYSFAPIKIPTGTTNVMINIHAVTFFIIFFICFFSSYM